MHDAAPIAKRGLVGSSVSFGGRITVKSKPMRTLSHKNLQSRAPHGAKKGRPRTAEALSRTLALKTYETLFEQTPSFSETYTNSEAQV